MTECLTTTMRLKRAMRGMTQAELAELAGTTRKSVNAVEMGHMVPSTILALKLAHALDVTVEELFAIEQAPD